MQVVIRENADEVGEYVARAVLARAHAGRLSVLGVATGSSPVPVYRALAAARDEVVSTLTLVALDEYVGLPPGHPESYHAVVARDVAEPLGIAADRVHVPEGNSVDLAGAGRRFEDAIVAAGGVDLQILGIGSTGHIGFNEPTSSFASRTRVKTLTRETREANARFFPSIDDVPTHCLTQGLGTIMDARELVLVAIGEGKADAVAAAVEGPLTSMCPGSILQLHPDATVVLDRAAASRLRLTEYYEYVFANRPDWQRD